MVLFRLVVYVIYSWSCRLEVIICDIVMYCCEYDVVIMCSISSMCERKLGRVKWIEDVKRFIEVDCCI